MTGSAFAIYIARGTLCTGWLRRITYYITNRAREHGVHHRTGRRGWRMTGSALKALDVGVESWIALSLIKGERFGEGKRRGRVRP